jgi:hypothetical protein
LKAIIVQGIPGNLKSLISDPANLVLSQCLQQADGAGNAETQESPLDKRITLAATQRTLDNAIEEIRKLVSSETAMLKIDTSVRPRVHELPDQQ